MWDKMKIAAGILPIVGGLLGGGLWFGDIFVGAGGIYTLKRKPNISSLEPAYYLHFRF